MRRSLLAIKSLQTSQLMLWPIMQQYIKDSFLQFIEDIKTTNSVSWLRKNQAPWELVVSHWTATATFHRYEIDHLLSPDVAGIFDRWPILRHPMGHVLIEEDFKFLNLSTEVNTIASWQMFFEKIQKLSPLKKYNKKTNFMSYWKLQE